MRSCAGHMRGMKLAPLSAIHVPFTREEKRHGVSKPLVLSHPVNNWKLGDRELSSEAKYWTTVTVSDCGTGSNVQSLKHLRNPVIPRTLMMQTKAGNFGTDCSHPHSSHSVMAMSHLHAGTHTGCGNSADRLCPHRVDIKPGKGSGMEILEKWLCVTVNNGCPGRVSGRVCGATTD